MRAPCGYSRPPSYAAEDDFSAARSVLMSVASHNGDTAAATILRYVDWKLGEREEVYTPDPVDYLAAPVGGKADMPHIEPLRKRSSRI
jgi:hypothetical protein